MRKLLRYLSEARASEDALVRLLQSQIPMTPSGDYRSALERHLAETRDHRARVGKRLEQLGERANPVTAVVGFWEDMFGQALAVSKAPFDLLRGSGGEDKVLRNARDVYAAEAWEIASYTAIERLARAVGDQETAELARSILADEQRMLDRILREIPKLSSAVVIAEIAGGEESPTPAPAAPAPDDLAIPSYDGRNAQEIVARLATLSQIELVAIDAYERGHENRSTVLERISALRAEEPWPGYDELNVAEVIERLARRDSEQVKRTRDYERAHKDRAGVLRAAARVLADG
ncbi:MAG: DUF892 family protein [Solirubrobacterales bacterium]|nr:DUF892 family protein [Solirubrobacterales bacterium]